MHTTGDEINQFIDAIKKYYYFEMNYDDLPLRGFIGTEKLVNEVPHYFLFKHLHFHFLFNKDQVIFGNVTADPTRVIELAPGSELQIEFSYSAEWSETGKIFYFLNFLKNRWKYNNHHFIRYPFWSKNEVI